MFSAIREFLGKDCSKILNALRLKGFKSVEKLF